MEGTALIGIDTNVLLRSVLNDDVVQSAQAQAFLETLTPYDPGYLSLLVLCEFAWVLGRTYRHSRTQIVLSIERLLDMAGFQVERPEVVWKALGYFRTTRADFGDCCIAVAASLAGSAYIVTFDEAASSLPGMRLLGDLQT